MNLILLGAPGCGKGTVAGFLSKKFGMLPISTGDIIRENIRNKTKLGLLSEKLINDGKLVPDEYVIEFVKNKLNSIGNNQSYILDGFPRTIIQADGLKSFAKIDKVILIDTDYEVILDRILSRRICPNCKKVFNTKSYSKDNCDICNESLISRSDDNEDIVKKRYNVYLEQTKPLIEYYSNQNLLYKVNGNLSAEEVFKQIDNILQNEGL